MESKYLARFEKLRGNESLYRLNGGRLLVEILPKPEVKTQGGLIMAAPKEFARGTTFESQSGIVGVVLLAGDGYVDSDGTSYALDTKPGTVVLLNDFSVRTLSVFPGLMEYLAGSIAIVDETSVQLQWPSLEAYKQFEKILN
jgi:co-chaperonin GroES (HSP10)